MKTGSPECRPVALDHVISSLNEGNKLKVMLERETLQSQDIICFKFKFQNREMQEEVKMELRSQQFPTQAYEDNGALILSTSMDTWDALVSYSHVSSRIVDQ